MAFDQRTIVSPTGAMLRLYTRAAEGRARAVVQINHGLAEHAARYERFADFLGARGFHVYAHDHRGHGHTTAPDAPLGRFAGAGGDAKVIADVAAVHDLIAAEHPGLPVILFGHSMGGLIALNFVLAHSARIVGAAIWNANFSAGPAGKLLARAILAWERFRLGSDVPSRLVPRFTLEAWAEKIPGRATAFDWLSRDPEEVRRYIDDPLCGWPPTVSMWGDIFSFIFAGGGDRNFSAVRRDLPFHIIGGAKDPSTDGGAAVADLAARLGRMGFSDVVSTIYPDARHESLNDFHGAEAMADFASWAERIAPDR